MNTKKNNNDPQGMTSASIKSIEEFPLIDSILVSKTELHKSDEYRAMSTSGTKESTANKQEQPAKESRMSTQYIDDSQDNIKKGSYGCEFVQTESVADSNPKPTQEKLSRKNSATSEFSIDKEEQKAGDEEEEEEFKEQIREPKLGSFYFRYEVSENGVTIRVENRDTFDLYTQTLKNEVIQEGLLGDLFDSPEDFGNEIISQIKSYPSPYIEFDESSVELTLYQLVDFGRKKARKPLLEIKLQNQNEFLKPLELCKSSTTRLSEGKTTEIQKLFLRVTDQLILQLEELEKQTLNLNSNISKLEEVEVN